ncbi:hypothetical protein [Halobaculum roseum]|uniref:Uncharacterized protein n=1 Tax=Halobaculum roseum TaxID=2175149 RepID=A0ABD5MMF1_9EURY|nr:hypothetical protein [Halobaculum roseum]QZY02901.1 hypothetical protein K6T36_01505 [Halobaculum roseum]
MSDDGADSVGDSDSVDDADGTDGTGGLAVRTGVALGVLGSLVAVRILLALFDVIDPAPGTAAYLLVGAVVAGAVAGWARTSRGLVAPTAVPAVVFLGAVTATWAQYVAPETTPTPVDPTPLGWVLLGWPAVVLVGVAAGAVELYAKTRD